ncbi:MAG: LamG-like jellyroll fold domain-containing protein, partial [Bacteroidota bacterium]
MQKLLHQLLVIGWLLLPSSSINAQNLSLDFDGVDDAVDTNLGASEISANPSGFTFEMWFRSTDQSASPLSCPDGMRTLTRLTAQNFNFELAACNGDLYVSEFYGTFAPPIQAIGPVVVNQWQHVRIDYDGTGFSIYLDCALVHSSANTISNRRTSIHLGEYGVITFVNQPRHWLGQID